MGVTGFDLSRTANPSVAAEQLRAAIPATDREATFFVRFPSFEDDPRPSAGPATVARLDRELQVWNTVLGGTRSVVVILDPGLPEPIAGELAHRVDAGELRDYAHRMGVAEDVAETAPRRLRAVDLSLLHPEAAARCERLGLHGPGVIAFDVFAGGALDGTVVRRGAWEVGPRGRPASIGELDATYAPVLRLGFLSRPGRPLARAALDFVLRWPWLLTAVVPLPPPERIDAVLGSPPGPALTDAELGRLGLGESSSSATPGPPPA